MEISSIAFRLGPFAIHWYAIFIVVGIVLGVFLASQEAKKVGSSATAVIDFILYVLPLSILGARAYYVLFHFSEYLENPVEILAIWHGGLAIYGGLITGVICLIVFCKKRQLSAFRFLDILAPSVLLAQAIGRWGNFVNQEAYGMPTTRSFLHSTLHLPAWLVDGMKIEGMYRQPTFLYESLWNFCGFFLILCFRHRKCMYLEGEIFLQYVAWYSLGRFFIEGMRSDSLLVFGTVRVSQALSLIFFFAAIVCFVVRRRRKTSSFYLVS